MSLDVKIKGFDELARKLRDIGADVPKELENAGMKGMLPFEGGIKKRAPVRTGDLMNSYTTEAVRTGDVIVITTGTNKTYAVWVEYGTGIYAENGNGRWVGWAYKDENGNWIHTRGNHPQPHVRPALDEFREKIPATVIQVLEDALRRRLM
jgi:HK97 gp10 family phage protein